MRKISVEVPPDCPECGVALKYLDSLVIPLIYKCPGCDRGFQASRSKDAGWEKVAMYFDYHNARFPEREDMYDGES